MDVQRKERLSGIELLKLIAMFMIVMSHSGPYYGDVYAESYVNLRESTTNIQNLLLVLYIYMGQIGNCIFLMCSAYFLLEKKKVKGEKVLYFLGDCLFFSVSFLLVFLLAGQELSWLTILKQFFPTTFDFNWYVGCYLLVYIMHPALNLIIDHLSRKQLLLTDLVGLVLYSLMQMLVRDSFHYNRLIGFILIYFLMAYCKKYLRNTCCNTFRNVLGLFGAGILLVGVILITNVLGFYTDTFANKMLYFSIFVNPLIIWMSFCTFYLFQSMKFKNGVVNLLASVTLYIYVIHENYLFATYARPRYFAYIYETFTYEKVAFWAFVLAAVCFGGSLLVGLLYRATLQRPVHKCCHKLAKILFQIADRFAEYLIKWN